MSTPTRLRGKSIDGATMEQEMSQKNGYGSGSIVYTTPLVDFTPEFKPFINDTFGTSMNQNVSFSGTPELIFDGGSGGSEWSGSGPEPWDFSDGGKVVLGHGPDNSQALFEDSGTIDTSNYAALTGLIDLDNYTPSTQDLMVQFGFSGTPLGVAVGLNSFIDTSDFSEQSFVIGITEFNLLGATVNEFTITVQRSGGHNPHVKFDNFQLEETGQPLVFKAEASKGERYYVKQIIIQFAAPQDTTLSNNSMPALAYNKILGIGPFINGLLFQTTKSNKVGFAVSFRKYSDFTYVGLYPAQPIINDGDNSFLSLQVTFEEPILLDGKTSDNLSFTVNDDLTGFLELRASLRGFIELDNED